MTKKRTTRRKAKPDDAIVAPEPAPGKVSAYRTVDVMLIVTAPTAGVRINLDQLGIGHGADSVAETSGNNKYLDSARPPVIEGGDLLVFFDPQMSVGQCNLSFAFTWDNELESVTPKPLEDGKYAGVVEVKKARKRG